MSIKQASAQILALKAAAAEEEPAPVLQAESPLAARLKKRRSLRQASRAALSLEAHDQRAGKREGGSGADDGAQAQPGSTQDAPPADKQDTLVNVGGKDFGLARPGSAAAEDTADKSSIAAGLGRQEANGEVGGGWMNLKGMSASKVALKAVGLFSTTSATVAAQQEGDRTAQAQGERLQAHGDTTDAGQGSKDGDDSESEEGADLVGDLDVARQSMSRGSRRPRTHGSARGSLGSENLAFSAYEPEVSEVRSHVSRETREESASSASSDSPKSRRTSHRVCGLCVVLHAWCPGVRVDGVLRRVRVVSQAKGRREDLR